MNSSTGTTLVQYLEWLTSEAERKVFGEVGIHFKIVEGQIVDVQKTSIDKEHFSQRFPAKDSMVVWKGHRYTLDQWRVIERGLDGKG